MSQDFSTQQQPTTHTSLPDQAKTWLNQWVKKTNKTIVITITSSIVIIALLVLVGSPVPILAYSEQMQHEELPVSLPASLANTTTLSKKIHTIIHSGDSASTALHRLDFSSRDVLAMANASKTTYPLTRVHPGQKLERTDRNGTTQLTMDIDPINILTITRQADGNWLSTMGKRSTTSRWLVASGVIHNSFFLDASRAGMDGRTIVNLAYIFGWDIDFARDLRKGDHFSVLLNEQYNNQGKPIVTTILAAEFTNRGKTFRAIRFTDKHGTSYYYAPDGSSMRKNFLKAPVKFTRISSRFTLARMHPILGYTRAHRGVDYAAPIGTPVHAIGAGKIVYLGRRGGYGRFIQIKHRNRHNSTAYAHLSRYAKGLHKGSWVEQGQVIGFVGMSGLATGPHLHFEFRVNGRAINPLHIKRTPAQPVSRKLRAKFKRQSKRMMLALQQEPKQQPTEVAWQ